MKTESEIKIILSDQERKDIKSALEKLTDSKIGFNLVYLTDDEKKIINAIKDI